MSRTTAAVAGAHVCAGCRCSLRCGGCGVRCSAATSFWRGRLGLGPWRPAVLPLFAWVPQIGLRPRPQAPDGLLSQPTRPNLHRRARQPGTFSPPWGAPVSALRASSSSAGRAFSHPPAPAIASAVQQPGTFSPEAAHPAVPLRPTPRIAARPAAPFRPAPRQLSSPPRRGFQPVRRLRTRRGAPIRGRPVPPATGRPPAGSGAEPRFREGVGLGRPAGPPQPSQSACRFRWGRSPRDATPSLG